MNTGPENQLASRRGCYTCVPMLIAEAAVRRADLQREKSLEHAQLQAELETTQASNWFMYLYRKWRQSSLHKELAEQLQQNDIAQMKAIEQVRRRQQECRGQICDDNGRNYRCGFSS